MHDSTSSPKSVLVVDDNRDICDMLQSLLESRGFIVATSQRPSQALRLAESAPPDLAVLDIAMPEFDGFELCRLLRSLDRPPTVFLMTAARVDDDSRRLSELYGAHGIFEKPLGLPIVLEAIEAERVRFELTDHQADALAGRSNKPDSGTSPQIV